MREASMRYTGFHEDVDIPIKVGDTVTIKKGVKIHTTMPSNEPGEHFKQKVAGRTYKVKVKQILNGFTRDGQPARNPSVRWAGAGGYWHEVDINDIPEANQ